MLELREARYFIAVAEELHFGRAAGRLHMSQPPLSQSMKTLEQRLGAELLIRTTRSVALTPAGEVFLERCRHLVNLAEEAETAARQAAGGHLGRLRIGAVTSAFSDPLPSMLATFRGARPHVEVVLQEMDTHRAARALAEHTIDVALVRQLATPAGLQRRTLRTEEFVLVVPAWGDLARQDVARLEEVASLPWVWLPRHIAPDYHDQVVACCRAHGFAPTVTHTAHSITSQLAMVACGLGVALVPETSAEHATGPSEHLHFMRFSDAVSIELAAVWGGESDNSLVTTFLETTSSRC